MYIIEDVQLRALVESFELCGSAAFGMLRFPSLLQNCFPMLPFHSPTLAGGTASSDLRANTLGSWVACQKSPTIS